MFFVPWWCLLVSMCSWRAVSGQGNGNGNVKILMNTVGVRYWKADENLTQLYGTRIGSAWISLFQPDSDQYINSAQYVMDDIMNLVSQGSVPNQIICKNGFPCEIKLLEDGQIISTDIIFDNYGHFPDGKMYRASVEAINGRFRNNQFHCKGGKHCSFSCGRGNCIGTVILTDLSSMVTVSDSSFAIENRIQMRVGEGGIVYPDGNERVKCPGSAVFIPGGPDVCDVLPNDWRTCTASCPQNKTCPNQCATCDTTQQNVQCKSTAQEAPKCQNGYVQSFEQTQTSLKTLNSDSKLQKAICQKTCRYQLDTCATCKSLHYGPTCEPCGVCHNNGTCCSGNGSCNDGKTGNGECTCVVGASGEFCQFTRNTTCYGHGNPDSTGQCTCDANWDSSKKCQQCLPSFFGPNCQTECSPDICNKAGTCNSEGKCECSTGFTGQHCGQCSSNHFGTSCVSCTSSNCSEKGTCADNGIAFKCVCNPGFAGDDCSSCEDGMWGFPNCQACSTCNGKNVSSVCNKDNGDCSCSNPYFGSQCDGPVIQSIRPNEIDTANVQLTITGEFLSTTQSVKVDGQNCSILSPSFTEVKCDLGTRFSNEHSDLNVVVQTAANSSVPFPLKVLSPAISIVNPLSGLDTAGGTLVTISGRSFFECTASNCVQVEVCVNDPDNEVSTVLNKTCGELNCNTQVSISGNSKAVDTLCPVHCNKCTANSQQWSVAASAPTQIVAQASAGYGNQRIRVSVCPELRCKTGWVAVSFASSTVLSAIEPAAILTAGAVITIKGTNFVDDAAKLQPFRQVTVGVFGACRVIAVSATQLTCSAPPGIGASVTVKVNIDGITQDAYFKYQEPSVHKISGCNTPLSFANSVRNCLAGQVITLEGTSFGTQAALQQSSTVTIGGQGCTDLKVISEHTRLACTIPAGSGTDLAVQFLIDGQGNSSATLSFFTPTISDVSFVTASDGTKTANNLKVNTFKQVQLKVEGNWGIPNSSTADYQVKVGSRVCAVNQATNSSLQCQLPVGNGQHLPITVAVQSYQSAPAAITYSFLPPELQNNTIRLNYTAQGSAAVSGVTTDRDVVYFDVLLGGTSDLAVFFGPFQCSIIDIIATQSAQPNGGGIHTVSCKVLRRKFGTYSVMLRAGPDTPTTYYNLTGTDTYSYPRNPVIDNVTGCDLDDKGTKNCPTQGWTADQPILLTIKGHDFGTAGAFISIGGRECRFPAHQGSTSLTCQLPVGSGVGQLIEIRQTSGGASLFSLALPLISFKAPRLESMQGCPSSGCARTGNPLVTIVGSDFGPSKAQVVVAGLPCESSRHATGKEHTELLCNLAPGAGSNQSIFVIQQGGSVSTTQLFFDFTKCPQGTFNNGTACPYCQSGKYTNTEDAIFCLPCPAGKSGGQQPGTCAKCKQGTFSTEGSDCKACEAGEESTDGLRCRRCNPGKYRPSTEKLCIPCNKGTYQDQPGKPECQNCPPGTYSDFEGQVSCQLCSPGKARESETSSQCTTCPQGRVANANHTQCSECPEGTFSWSGATACQLCINGTFTSSPGQSSCSTCGEGKYAERRGMTVCKECPAGKFSGSLGLISCQACSQGLFAPKDGSTSCQACQAGRFQNTSAQSFCTSCAVGRYSSVLEATACRRCSPGSFANSTNMTVCQSCPPGKFSNLGSAYCIDCVPGKYSKGGAVLCTLAPPRYFVNRYGASEPTLCQNGTTSSLGSTICSLCEKGKVSINGQACFPCASGLVPNSFSQPEQCVLCGAGSSKNQSTHECQPCPVGKFGEEGSTTCRQCARGQFSSVPGSTTCLLCANSTYSSVEGASVCARCPSGTFSGVEGAFSCNLCQLGFESQESAKCKPCKPGSFRDGQYPFCSVCPQGKYTDLAGRSTCTLCQAGHYQNFRNQTSCLLCIVGRYQDEQGASDCKVCENGLTTILPGQPKCTPCQKGESSTNGTCVECPKGSYADDVGQTACKPCSSGKFGASARLAQCQSCPVGTFSATSSSTRCDTCGQGSYQSLTGQSVCQVCSPGFFQANTGGTECLSCPAGTSSGSNATSCKSCQEGKYSSPESSSCTNCTVGRYGDRPSATECQQCPAGQYQDKTGSTTCLQCPPAKYSGRGQENCTLCGRGTFQDQYGGEECVACPAGKASNGTGVATCSSCSGGSYSNTNGLFSCLLCDAGTESDGVDATNCKLCPRGSVSYKKGSRCENCPVGVETSPDRTRCICPKGTFYHNNKCDVCPLGADCSQEGNYFDVLRVKAGWWRPNASSMQFQRCLVSRHCQGGRGTGQCEDKRGGPLCMVCNNNTRSATKLSKCEECPKVGTSVAVSVLLSLVVVLVVVGVAWLVLRSGRELEEQLEAEDRLREGTGERESTDFTTFVMQDVIQSADLCIDAKVGMIAKHQQKMRAKQEEAERQEVIYGQRVVRQSSRARPNFLYKFKIMATFLQISTNLTFVTEVPWPTAFADFISTFDVVNLSFVPWNTVACVSKFDYYSKTYVLTLLPLGLSLLIVLLFFVPQRCRIKRQSRRYYGAEDVGRQIHVMNKINAIKRQFRKAQKLSLFGLFLIYPSVSSQIMRMYMCRYINNEWVLFADFSLRCFDSLWYANIPFSIAMMIIFPIGIPAVFFFMLQRRRKRHSLTDVRVRIQLGFLYDAFELNMWYWETVDMLYKLVMTSIIGFFPAKVQISVALCVCMLYTIALLVCSPYLRQSDMALHTFTQNAIFLLLLMGYTVNIKLDRGKSYFDPKTDLIFSILLITATVLCFLLFAVLSFLSVKRMLITRNRKRAYVLHQKMVQEQDLLGDAERDENPYEI